MLERIISGGQTGADMAGLRSAKNVGLLTGGTAPKAFQTESGPNPDLKTIYGLKAFGNYKSRTIQNIRDSDGTIVFLLHRNPGGSTKTIGYCHTEKWVNGFKSSSDGFRPVLVITKAEMEEKMLEKTCVNIARWILYNRLRVLNVAGHRQSTAFQRSSHSLWNYGTRVEEILTLVFITLFTTL